MTGKLLVTGASGQLGAAVMHHLIDTYKVPASSIIAGSRDVAKLSDLAGRGVETRKVDFDDADTLARAFDGVDKVLIISTDALDGEGTRLRQHLAAVAAAKAAGVGHISYTSMPNPEDAKVTFAPDHKKTEDAIKATGLGYTIFRNSWYMENLLMTLPHAVASGQWYSSAGTGKVAHISRDDVARAIAASLAKPASGNAVYTLTGPVAYSTEEIADLVSKTTGKPLAVVHVTDEQLGQGMAGAGVPAPFIPTFVSFDTNTREGKIDIVTDDAATLSGAKLTSLTDFLNGQKAALLG
ncbi:SDR family oxidoreductase [Hoeflea sp.]|uniref:SDR family oxidoreductase n=1 Tax=Hoeflea sp. TaxID=1940281 RepID=UPI003A8D43EA